MMSQCMYKSSPFDDIIGGPHPLIHALQLGAQLVLLHHRLVVLSLQHLKLRLYPRQVVLVEVGLGLRGRLPLLRLLRLQRATTSNYAEHL